MEIWEAVRFFEQNDVAVQSPHLNGLTTKFRLERVKGSAGVIVYVGREELIRRASNGELPRVRYNPLDWEGNYWRCQFCGTENDTGNCRHCRQPKPFDNR